MPAVSKPFVAINGYLYPTYGPNPIHHTFVVHNGKPVARSFPDTYFYHAFDFDTTEVPGDIKLYRTIVTMENKRYLIGGYLQDDHEVNQSLANICPIPWKGEIAVVGLGAQRTFVTHPSGPRSWITGAVILFMFNVMEHIAFGMDGQLPKNIVRSVGSPVCERIKSLPKYSRGSALSKYRGRRQPRPTTFLPGSVVPTPAVLANATPYEPSEDSSAASDISSDTASDDGSDDDDDNHDGEDGATSSFIPEDIASTSDDMDASADIDSDEEEQSELDTVVRQLSVELEMDEDEDEDDDRNTVVRQLSVDLEMDEDNTGIVDLTAGEDDDEEMGIFHTHTILNSWVGSQNNMDAASDEETDGVIDLTGDDDRDYDVPSCLGTDLDAFTEYEIHADSD